MKKLIIGGKEYYRDSELGCYYERHKCPSPLSSISTKGHTKDFGIGFSAGVEDGKSGVYDPAAACARASNQDHRVRGYKDAHVAACVHGKFGCGDKPTTCTQGEKCVLPYPSPPPQPCKGNGTCPPPGPIPCKKGEVMINGKCVSLGSCRLIDNGTQFVRGRTHYDYRTQYHTTSPCNRHEQHKSIHSYNLCPVPL